ncbi:MAG: PEP-CTERM sorting domain-containing protein [Planctomycetales bacterium]|nr:PEP-CTERM sorting domain-containing protein [Planctomycetales bacterium]
MRRWCWGLLGAFLLLRPGFAADVVLNEYNAVSGSNRLDDGKGIDRYFGTIVGNGGNWFELLVVNDHVDMRGWRMDWTEDEPADAGGITRGSMTLSQDPIWSDLRAGSLITFIETVDAGGVAGKNTQTDISYDPVADDWWINVATREEVGKGASALVTTTTNDGTPGDFSTGKSDWTLTILNSAGATVYGPVGEGANWGGDGVSDKEGGSLEGPDAQATTAETIALWQALKPDSKDYDDTTSTSFGMPNVSYDSVTQTFSPNQDVLALRTLVVSPVGSGDFNGDGQLTVDDIDELTAAILAGSIDAKYDVDKDGKVNGDDRATWVRTSKKTYFGDANLDGEFNTSDFVTVLGAGKYETGEAATWGSGDWDGDGLFSTADLVTALMDGGYEQGPRAAVAAVPEPASVIMLALGSLGLLIRRRQ